MYSLLMLDRWRYSNKGYVGKGAGVSSLNFKDKDILFLQSHTCECTVSFRPSDKWTEKTFPVSLFGALFVQGYKECVLEERCMLCILNLRLQCCRQWLITLRKSDVENKISCFPALIKHCGKCNCFSMLKLSYVTYNIVCVAWATVAHLSMQ